MDDSDLLFDEDLDLAIIENEQRLSNSNKQEDDDFNDDDDDDFDMNELVEVAETIEQQHARGHISFISDAEDPEPPPPLPESTPCFHPFDSENVRTWIYPINYPIRAYQLNIVKKAMFHNTLVALPTGLGKTFIAAVVMYNYYRWFPNSKVIFMAPTRPLVTQQIEACFSICGLPQEDTTDMMGTTSPAKRRELWKSKRVFFATPQTVQKDIETNGCPTEKVSCVVVDEAHRATGNFAYTEVVRKLYKKNKEFRVLALTATPGSNLDAVQDVVDNLHITNIQIRTEDSMDIREYSYGKRIERRIVRLDYVQGSTGILPRVISDFRAKVLLPLLEDLSKKPTSVVASIERASPFGLRAARLHFQATCKNLNNGLKFSIVSLFLVTEAASRAHDLLCQHGVVPFLESVETTFQEYKTKLDEGGKLTKPQTAFYNHPVLNAIVRDLKRQVANPDFIGHPKLEQLTTILLNHFTSLAENEHSKVMVFSSFRSSVADICNVLNRHQPIIRSSFFVGQASDKAGTKGLKQSEQQDVIQKFKKNEYNVLVSTSIGEEGLDIGELDLIICFDSQTSPIRMLQRMGRTGRKRQGKCILLLTETEEKKYSQAKDTYERIQRLIARGGLIRYYGPNPTILPASYKPVICKKKIDVGVYQPKENTKKRKRGGGNGLAVALSDFTPEGVLKPYVESSFIRSFGGTFGNMQEVRDAHWPVLKTRDAVNRYMPLQSRLQTTFRVGHGRRTRHFVQLVEKIEHQILHPHESFQASKPTATRLVLPSKHKKKKAATKPSTEGDFEDFLEHTDVSRIIESVAPHKRDKGKQKMMDEDFDPSFGLEESSPPSWEPMLSDHMFENPSPGQSLLSMDQPSPPLTTATSIGEMQTNMKVVMEDEDEFDDFPDDFFIEHADAFMIAEPPNTTAFDSSLEPLFPFEKNTGEKQEEAKVVFLWAQELPNFGDKALVEFEKKQERFKAVYGRYANMKFIPKYRVASEVQGSLRINENVYGSSLLFNPQSPTLGHRSPSLSKEPQVVENDLEALNDDISSPPVAFTNHSSPRENSIVLQDDQFELDFNEDMLANFLENKFSEDEGHDFSTFLFEPENEETKQTQQHIMKRSLLYAKEDTSSRKADNSKTEADAHFDLRGQQEETLEENKTKAYFEEEEEEPIFVIDFDQLTDDDLSIPETESKKSPVVVIESKEKETSHMDPKDEALETNAEPSSPRKRDKCISSFGKDISTSFSPDLPNKDTGKNAREGILIESSDDDGDKEQARHSNSKAGNNRITVDSSDEESALDTDKLLPPSLTTTPNIDQRKSISPASGFDREDSESPLVRRYPRKRTRIISEDEPGSPVSLLSLSKGLHSPSPFRNDDSETSPIAVRRRLKKRATIEDDDDSVVAIESTRKRLKQKLSSDSFDNDDEEGFEIASTTRNSFLERLQQSGYGAHRNRQFSKENYENPFIDDEAEKSEDGGHTEEEASDGSSLMNSFIDDSSSVDPSSRLSNDDRSSTNHGNLYLHDLIESQPLSDRHWMNRFNAEKWLNNHTGEDLEAVTEEEEEIESIQDFSSAFDNPAANLIDDDDFM